MLTKQLKTYLVGIGVILLLSFEVYLMYHFGKDLSIFLNTETSLLSCLIITPFMGFSLECLIAQKAKVISWKKIAQYFLLSFPILVDLFIIITKVIVYLEVKDTSINLMIIGKYTLLFVILVVSKHHIIHALTNLWNNYTNKVTLLHRKIQEIYKKVIKTTVKNINNIIGIEINKIFIVFINFLIIFDQREVNNGKSLLPKEAKFVPPKIDFTSPTTHYFTLNTNIIKHTLVGCWDPYAITYSFCFVR